MKLSSILLLATLIPLVHLLVYRTKKRKEPTVMDNTTTEYGNNLTAYTVLELFMAAGTLLTVFGVIGIFAAVGCFIVSALIGVSINIANHWEKAVILRMGKFKGLKGPGVFFIIPIIDRVYKYIDQRVRVTDFKAEETLTSDTVPVNVDAVVYWMVWDPEKAALELEEYTKAVYYIAQTALRDCIGKHNLTDLLQNRKKIAETLQTSLDEHTNPWGITCQTVGIKDIVIPSILADAMSKRAQAERERQARIILGTAETEISEKFAQASQQYLNDPVALQLRGMNMLFEGLKEKGSLVIVPSSALESMNLGAAGGMAALAKTGEHSPNNQ